MTQQRRAAASGTNPWLPLALLAAYTAVSLALWGAVTLAGALTGHPVAANPLNMPIALLGGLVAWPGPVAVVVLVAELVVLAGLATVGITAWRRRNRRKTRVDAAARSLATPTDLAAYTGQGVASSAQQLRPSTQLSDDPSEHGLLVGRTVPGEVDVRGSWEDTHVDIWGPRTGKTTARAITAMLAAPGAAMGTTNKRDLHDSTRGVRELIGDIYNFDPQDIIDTAPPEFWFNPLRMITKSKQATELVSHFTAATRPADAKIDGHFDVEGEKLMGYLFLAAARSGGTLADAYEWAANSRDKRPLTILQQRSGDRLVARKLRSTLEGPEKTRDSIYGSAIKLLSCLEDPDVLRWVTPPSTWEDPPDEPDSVPEFDPHAFVASTDTLYLHSQEGPGSASPLVAALTQAVFDAGKDRARTQPAGRLDPPVVCVLDEAANVCRIRELPNLYSHFGSRGIVVMTILQSWEQGVEAWGRSGMQKLWDSANVRVYGGGVADPDFLGKVSKLIGKHDITTHSTTRDRSGHTSRSTSPRREEILDVEDLAALPRGRAVVVASGTPAALIRPVPWMEGPHAEEIRASLAAYDPGQKPTSSTSSGDE